jgi:hypothetical protein
MLLSIDDLWKYEDRRFRTYMVHNNIATTSPKVLDVELLVITIHLLSLIRLLMVQPMARYVCSNVIKGGNE